MATQTLTFAFSQSALYAVNAGAWFPEPVTGKEYTEIQTDYESDTAPPTHDVCTYKRCVPNPEPENVFIEFELLENATGITTVFSLRRGEIGASRVYMTDL